MTNNDNEKIIKIRPLLGNKHKLIRLGREIASSTSDIKIDFSGVDTLNDYQKRFLFLRWSNLSLGDRQNLNDFICEGTVSEKLGDILDAIASEPRYLETKLGFSLISYWLIEYIHFIAPLSLFLLFIPPLSFSYWNFQRSYRVDSSEVILGTIYEPDGLKDLELYLEENLVPNNYIEYLFGNNKIDVTVEGSKDVSYKVAENKVITKQWDIFFASSPILSIKSKDNQYSWGFKMFPENKNDTYTSGFFVRSDSKIGGIEQINTSTTVALGEILSSASSFVVPVYELFGKTIKVTTGHRGHEIVTMVKSGQADIGAAAITDNRISNDSELRLIAESRPIPGSGVYFSPRLSRNDSANLKRAMASASKQIQLKANYGIGKEPDYTAFRTIIEKVDEILVCADFSQEDINLFCPKGFKPKILVGSIHGWKAERNNYILFLKEENNGSTLNHIVIDKELFRSLFETEDPQKLQGKRLKTKTPESQNVGNEVPTFLIKSAAQIELLD